MEIPPSTLEELKCSVCEGYLSRGPVYIQQDSAAVCGVCFTPKREAIRNKQYEATAKLLLFPCKNRDLGCQENVPFVNGEEVIGHEEVCQYRQYVCPILGSARCDWVGNNINILKHSEEQHTDMVKSNPITLTHDISKPSDQTFLLRAFQLLFLLHVKICVTSGKIFHAIRYLGRSCEANNFTFKLDIKRNDDEQLTRKGQVAPQGCLAIQEDTSLVLDTNGLLSVLGGFDGATFTVTVNRLASAVEKCTKCKVLITSFIYRAEGNWWCEQCAPKKEDCPNNNCSYKDFSNKITKHRYLCEKTNTCRICGTTISIGSLYTHYNSTHKIEKYNSGSAWRTKLKRLSDLGYCILSSIGGIGMCIYFFDNSSLVIRILSPVSSEQLREFKCTVLVTQTATGQTRSYTPETNYNEYYDWTVEIKNTDFTAWSHEFDVCVDIIKIEP